MWEVKVKFSSCKDLIIPKIQWSQLPTYEQMSYILEIAENNLFDFESKKGVFSVKQLAWYLNTCRTYKNIMDKDIFNSQTTSYESYKEKLFEKHNLSEGKPRESFSMDSILEILTNLDEDLKYAYCEENDGSKKNPVSYKLGNHKK